MSESVKKVLIIGGGFSGMSAAIQLRKSNVEVHLVEKDSNWQADGAGISIGGATLRAFESLGILDEFLALGSGHDGLDLFTQEGHHIQHIPTPRFAGPHIPGAGAILRPTLAKILANKVTESGAQVRLGQVCDDVSLQSDSVKVSFSNGDQDTFDLVVAADGLYSSARKTTFPNAPEPKYSGQGVWRAILPRPEECMGTMMWVGPKLKAGINPTSKDDVYLFLTVDSVEKQRFDPDQEVDVLKQLLIDNFKAPLIHKLAEQIDGNSHVMFRPLDSLLMPQPWHSGRMVFIGDTVHATTPHLASGACIGIEDAIVLAEELVGEGELSEQIQRFEQRRWERCRMVVENSRRLGEIEINGGDKQEHAGIMRDSLMALAQTI